jgi:hypothetical protein
MDTTTKLWRLVFALFRLLSTLIALTLVVGAVVVYASEPLSMLIPHEALVAVLAGGSLTALFSFVSFLVIGVKKRTDGARGARVRWIVIDAILMAALASVFFYSALTTVRQSTNLTTTAKPRFSKFWESASPTLLTLIQAEGQCCGFDGYTDRVLEPCKKYSEAVGCWSVLQDEYAYYLHLLVPALFILASLCTTAGLIALIFLVMRLRSARKNKNEGGDGLYYETDESFRINRSQPFDAWHKAVFSA